ncbi:lysozyme g [Bombina bombina]|uniref:lysozyme g n=1 Tax=Bombina bombina TaxID=8345 RepID=UPI00235AF9C1|nr:lysozyme g [Bombina bombina]
MALRHADIMTVSTTGASAQTAGYDNLSFSGVKASQHMADNDLRNLNRYKSKILTVARRYRVDPALLGGITSRETRGGGYHHNGWGDNGNGFGLMQVDKRYHQLCGSWDSEEHLNQATGILIYMMESIDKKFPHWNSQQRLKGALAAYNAGPNKVVDENIDKHTTGQDYANDVIARAQYFKHHGY